MVKNKITERCRGSKLFGAAGELYWREQRDLWYRASDAVQDRYLDRIVTYLDDNDILWSSVPDADKGRVATEAVNALSPLK